MNKATKALKARDSTPISNFFQFMDFHTELFWSVMLEVNRAGSKNPVAFCKEILGKQTYTVVYSHRYWVWEQEHIRIFASVRGISVEAIVDEGHRFKSNPLPYIAEATRAFFSEVIEYE